MTMVAEKVPEASENVPIISRKDFNCKFLKK